MLFLSKKDCYLLLRFLCRISMQKGSAEKKAEGETQAGGAAPAVEELSPLTRKARALALEMILLILKNAGPCFLSEDVFVKLIRQHLCVSISRNGIVTNTTLFELSISIFLLVIRHFRSQLKPEIEIIMNTVYLHVLEMGNSSFKQKSLILQALLKICESPQILADFFLNYDCDLTSASVYDRIVNICAKIAQTKSEAAPSPVSLLSFAASVAGFETKTDVNKIQEKRLQLRSLVSLSLSD
jgi:brefeldin A-inhibited guanine nucleotide-exchange protein